MHHESSGEQYQNLNQTCEYNCFRSHSEGAWWSGGGHQPYIFEIFLGWYAISHLLRSLLPKI